VHDFGRGAYSNEIKTKIMKYKVLMASLLALGVSALTANACLLQIRVACPNDTTSSDIRVYVEGVKEAFTDSLGIAEIDVPFKGETYTVCVDPDTLPEDATLSPLCQRVKVADDAPDTLNVEFVLGGEFCKTPPPPGPCWLTGGGTIGKTKGVANYSFGGVVYPGCSPKAAEGGNWNVVDHVKGLHFQGQQIIVTSCSGVSTRSPKVNVNVIDFFGFGILSGIGGNPDATIAVSFVARAIDNLEPGGGSDMLFLSVSAGSTVVLQIGDSVDAPAIISTGNLQIHTTSCGD
jgi:hypothetical protein